MALGECSLDRILEKIPRPNLGEMLELYRWLDDMARRIGRVLAESAIFDKVRCVVEFDKADAEAIRELIERDPEVMVPFFVMLCGLSDREFERLHGIRKVYELGRRPEPERLGAFAHVVNACLRHPLYLETVLFKFYKNWEEHQKRHVRRRVEDVVISLLRERGYDAGKIWVRCGGKLREVDCAVPPNPDNVRVAILVRTGVFKDLVKRSKEFSSEFDELSKCLAGARFVAVYLVPAHERHRLDKIREVIVKERMGKKPYDFVALTEEDLETLLKKLAEWGIPRRGGS
ncbi:MAG: hypothetical protein ABWU84_09880 [Pyrobaculum sp.]|uniref:hypothetical protein n=1 Tax=Pyrobaculum sp. TaxID=2004705 RepID=UPI003EEB9412